MNQPQPGILADLPSHGRYLQFQLRPDPDSQRLLRQLTTLQLDEQLVIGLGDPLVCTLGGQLEPLSPFPQYQNSPVSIPATPAALWCWLRGDDRGELLALTRQLVQHFAEDLSLEEAVDAFRYGDGRDLTGYEDGTENPVGADAETAALVAGGTLAGSSFVAVQRWQHRMPDFAALSQTEQDHSIGRRLSDNEELDDAPPSAHVKRTAQESFTPEAFLVRRSMPWNRDQEEGLMFVAFARDFTAFEQQLKRMCGMEDGIVDALFRFTAPKSGSYFWCPPVADHHLVLDAALRK